MEARASVGRRGDGDGDSSSPGKRRGHDAPRREIGREPAQFLLSLYRQSISGSREHKTDPSRKSRVTAPQWIPRTPGCRGGQAPAQY